MSPNWQQTLLDIRQLDSHGDERLDPRTVGNAEALIRALAASYDAPDEVGSGHLPTIRLIWSRLSNPIEIEIHLDHLEYYRFAQRQPEIAELLIEADGPLPHALTMLLKPLRIGQKTKPSSG